MKKQYGVLWTAVVLVAFGFSLVLGQAEAAEKVFKWKCQTYAPPGSIAFRAQETALNHLKEATGGRLDIKLYGPGAVVGFTETLDAQGKGILEAGVNAAAYYAGKDPGFAALFTINAVWDNTFEANVWVLSYGGKELFEKAYGKYGVQFIGPVMMSNEVIMSKVPLRTLQDFKGIKVRTPAGLSAMLFTKLGASPVAVSGGEVYSALETGVVDAAEWVTLKDDWDIGLHEVTKYVLMPSFHAPIDICDFTVSKKHWDKLPPDLQAAVRIAVNEMSNLTDYWGEAESLKVKKQMIDKGLEFTSLSPADWQTVKQMSFDVADEWKKKSPLANEVISSIFSYLQMTGKMKK